MKVYVDELPKSCKDCFFCEHIEEDIDGKGRDEVACYFEGFLNNVLLGETLNAKNCKHLQSLSDHTKQVRKEVCEKITEELLDISHEYWKTFLKNGVQYMTSNDLCELLKEITNQIQGENNV